MASRRRFDPDRLVRDVGRRIGDLRVEQEMTQAQMALRMRCTTRYVAQIEAGRNITLHTLARLAYVLEVEVAALIEAPRATRPRARGRPRKQAPSSSATR